MTIQNAIKFHKIYASKIINIPIRLTHNMFTKRLQSMLTEIILP